jgi:hypothetical protein
MGIIINLVASYLKPYFDKIMITFSARWAARSEELKRKRELRVLEMAQNHQALILYGLEEMRCRLIEISHYLRGFFLFFLISFALFLFINKILDKTLFGSFFIILVLIGGSLSFYSSTRNSARAERIQEEIREDIARNEKKH